MRTSSACSSPAGSSRTTSASRRPSYGPASSEGGSGGEGFLGRVKKQSKKWSEEEQQRLLEAIGSGVTDTINWAEVARSVPGRTGKQCREKWKNDLRPDISKEPWTSREEYILARAHCEVGNQWAEIAKYLPGRSENSIKNHWNATLRSKAETKSRTLLWVYGRVVLEQKGTTSLESFEKAIATYTKLGNNVEPLDQIMVPTEYFTKRCGMAVSSSLMVGSAPGSTTASPIKVKLGRVNSKPASRKPTARKRTLVWESSEEEDEDCVSYTEGDDDIAESDGDDSEELNHRAHPAICRIRTGARHLSSSLPSASALLRSASLSSASQPQGRPPRAVYASTASQQHQQPPQQIQQLPLPQQQRLQQPPPPPQQLQQQAQQQVQLQGGDAAVTVHLNYPKAFSLHGVHHKLPGLSLQRTASAPSCTEMTNLHTPYDGSKLGWQLQPPSQEEPLDDDLHFLQVLQEIVDLDDGNTFQSPTFMGKSCRSFPGACGGQPSPFDGQTCSGDMLAKIFDDANAQSTFSGQHSGQHSMQQRMPTPEGKEAKGFAGLDPLQDVGTTDNSQAVDYDADMYCQLLDSIGTDGLPQLQQSPCYVDPLSPGLPVAAKAADCGQYKGAGCCTATDELLYGCTEVEMQEQCMDLSQSGVQAAGPNPFKPSRIADYHPPVSMMFQQQQQQRFADSGCSSGPAANPLPVSIATSCWGPSQVMNLDHAPVSSNSYAPYHHPLGSTYSKAFAAGMDLSYPAAKPWPLPLPGSSARNSFAQVTELRHDTMMLACGGPKQECSGSEQRLQQHKPMTLAQAYAAAMAAAEPPNKRRPQQLAVLDLELPDPSLPPF